MKSNKILFKEAFKLKKKAQESKADKRIIEKLQKILVQRKEAFMDEYKNKIERNESFADDCYEKENPNKLKLL